ncbi:hypothetical protein KY333_02165 [Candidatus Woesearchaeota archaeon]|nr:hypothetical protein [Candidatus Woesearchaeota archaeon]
MSETNINITEASFAELEAYLSLERNRWFIDDMWPLIEANPITPHSIDRLITDGWAVEKDEKKLFRRGQCDFDTKLITLYGNTEEYRRKPYSRDVTLMHEVVHAHYPRLNSQTTTTGEKFITSKIGETMTEWIARQIRTVPEVLRASVLWFDLKPYVYDRASYVAFVAMNPPGQKLFPFTYNCIGEIELALDADK